MKKIKAYLKHPHLNKIDIVKILSIGVITFFTLFTILGFFQILDVKTEYNLRQFFPTTHPLLKQDDLVKGRFQGMYLAPFLLVAELKDLNESWLKKEYLDEVKKLTEELTKVAHVKNVQNLSTLQGAVPSQSGLGVGTFIDYLTPEKLKKEIKRNPILSPLFVSRNERILNVFITTEQLSLAEANTVKQEIAKLGQARLPFANVSLGGVPAIQSDVNQILSREIVQFIIISFFMCLIALGLIFKNHQPILICTVSSFITNILSTWAISVFGFSFSVLSSTIPILVTMTVISISLHSILRLIERMEQHKNSHKSYPQVVIQTFRELFRPNLLTALTTSVGFFTLTLSDSPIIKEYGLSVGIALLVTWINSTTILPAFLILSPEPKMRYWMKAKARWAFFILKYHKSVLLVILSISFFGAWKGQHLSWQAKLFDDLPEDHAVRKTTAVVDQYLGGLVPLELEIFMPKAEENVWANDETIHKLESLTTKIREKKGVGSVITISDIIQGSGLRTGKNKTTISEVMFLMSMSQDNPLPQYLSADGYSPTTGRFLQSDPDPGRVIDPSSFNSKYIYAQNNPIMFSDPTGKGILEALGVLLTGFLAIVSGLWIGGLIHGLVGGSFWGGILGGVLGGIAGGALGSQIGGVVMGLAYQGEGRNYSDGQRMGMQIGGLVGGFFGSLAGAGNMNLDDFWGSFSKKSQCLAMSTPMGAAGSLIKRGVLGGTKSGLSNGELPENLRPDIEGQPHRLKPWEHPSSVPDISVPHNLNNSMQCPLS